MFACLPVRVEAFCSLTGEVSSVLRRSLSPEPCWLRLLSGMGSVFLVMLHLVGHECRRANQTVLSHLCSRCHHVSSHGRVIPRGDQGAGMGQRSTYRRGEMLDHPRPGELPFGRIKTVTKAPCQAQFLGVSPHATWFENRERPIAEVLTD